MTRVVEPPLIAVVDDDELFRRSIERLLKASGFRVEAFESAEAFLERGDADVIACAILDLKLPGMSGLDLQRRLTVGERPTAIVFVSAHDDPTVQAHALRKGAVAFLKKPFDGRVLIGAIDAAIK